ncbi:kinase-like protein [Purpureocillium lavendulum]|uniref:Kinase-like protein n=1 Tax=Purpureocillium lavendulum TaxID=1247861 RepID=A0AB34FIZ8_9HYPO|nr:kinase-like protein [Purpureocillium lavendulum]
MAPAKLPPMLPPGLPESSETPQAESADETSDSDVSDNTDNSDNWDGQPWEAAIPSVIIDMDDQLRNAIRQTFPDAQLQLRVFHINSNVVAYIKKWWKKAYESLDSDPDDVQESADALDVRELCRGNTKVKDMKNAKLGPLPNEC